MKGILAATVVLRVLGARVPPRMRLIKLKESLTTADGRITVEAGRTVAIVQIPRVEAEGEARVHMVDGQLQVELPDRAAEFTPVGLDQRAQAQAVGALDLLANGVWANFVLGTLDAVSPDGQHVFFDEKGLPYQILNDPQAADSSPARTFVRLLRRQRWLYGRLAEAELLELLRIIAERIRRRDKTLTRALNQLAPEVREGALLRIQWLTEAANQGLHQTFLDELSDAARYSFAPGESRTRAEDRGSTARQTESVPDAPTNEERSWVLRNDDIAALREAERERRAAEQPDEDAPKKEAQEERPWFVWYSGGSSFGAVVTPVALMLVAAHLGAPAWLTTAGAVVAGAALVVAAIGRFGPPTVALGRRILRWAARVAIVVVAVALLIVGHHPAISPTAVIVGLAAGAIGLARDLRLTPRNVGFGIIAAGVVTAAWLGPVWLPVAIGAGLWVVGALRDLVANWRPARIIARVVLVATTVIALLMGQLNPADARPLGDRVSAAQMHGHEQQPGLPVGTTNQRAGSHGRRPQRGGGAHARPVLDRAEELEAHARQLETEARSALDTRRRGTRGPAHQRPPTRHQPPTTAAMAGTIYKAAAIGYRRVLAAGGNSRTTQAAKIGLAEAEQGIARIDELLTLLGGEPDLLIARLGRLLRRDDVWIGHDARTGTAQQQGVDLRPHMLQAAGGLWASNAAIEAVIDAFGRLEARQIDPLHYAAGQRGDAAADERTAALMLGLLYAEAYELEALIVDRVHHPRLKHHIGLVEAARVWTERLVIARERLEQGDLLRRLKEMFGDQLIVDDPSHPATRRQLAALYLIPERHLLWLKRQGLRIYLSRHSAAHVRRHGFDGRFAGEGLELPSRDTTAGQYQPDVRLLVAFTAADVQLFLHELAHAFGDFTGHHSSAWPKRLQVRLFPWLRDYLRSYGMHDEHAAKEFYADALSIWLMNPEAALELFGLEYVTAAELRFHDPFALIRHAFRGQGTGTSGSDTGWFSGFTAGAVVVIAAVVGAVLLKLGHGAEVAAGAFFISHGALARLAEIHRRQLDLANDALARGGELHQAAERLVGAVDVENPDPVAVAAARDARAQAMAAHRLALDGGRGPEAFHGYRWLAVNALDPSVREAAQNLQRLSEAAVRRLQSIDVPGTEAWRTDLESMVESGDAEDESVIAELRRKLVRDRPWLERLYDLFNDPRYRAGPERDELQRQLVDLAGGPDTYRDLVKYIIREFSQLERRQINQSAHEQNPTLRAQAVTLKIGRLLAEQLALQTIVADHRDAEVENRLWHIQGELEQLVLGFVVEHDRLYDDVLMGLPALVKEGLIFDGPLMPEARQQLALLILFSDAALEPYRSTPPRVYQSNHTPREVAVSGWTSQLAPLSVPLPDATSMGEYHSGPRLVIGFANSPAAALMYQLALWLGDASGANASDLLHELTEDLYPWLHWGPMQTPRSSDESAHAFQADVRRVLALNREAALLLWGRDVVAAAEANFQRPEPQPEPQPDPEATIEINLAQVIGAGQPIDPAAIRALEIGRTLLQLARERMVAAELLLERFRAGGLESPRLRWVIDELRDIHDLFLALQAGFIQLGRRVTQAEFPVVLRNVAAARDEALRLKVLIDVEVLRLGVLVEVDGDRFGVPDAVMLDDWTHADVNRALKQIAAEFDFKGLVQKPRPGATADAEEAHARMLGRLLGEIKAIAIRLRRGRQGPIDKHLKDLELRVINHRTKMTEARTVLEANDLIEGMHRLLNGGLFVDLPALQVTLDQLAELYRYPRDGLTRFADYGERMYFSRRTAAEVHALGRWEGPLELENLPLPDPKVWAVHFHERRLVVVFRDARAGRVLKVASRMDVHQWIWRTDEFLKLFPPPAGSRLLDGPRHWLGALPMYDGVQPILFLNEAAAERVWGAALVEATKARFAEQTKAQRERRQGKAHELVMVPFGLFMLGLVIALVGGGIVALVAGLVAGAVAVVLALRAARREAGSAERSGLDPRGPPRSLIPARRGRAGHRGPRNRASSGQRPVHPVRRTATRRREPVAAMAPAIEARGVIQRRVLVNGTAVTLQVVPGESAANLDFVVKDLTHLLTWDFEPNQRHLLNLPWLEPGLDPAWATTYDYVIVLDGWDGVEKLLELGEMLDGVYKARVHQVNLVAFDQPAILDSLVAEQGAFGFDDLARVQALLLYADNEAPLRFGPPMTEVQLAELVAAFPRHPLLAEDRLDREFRGLVKRMRSGEGDAIAAEINELGHHLMRLAGERAWPEFLEHLAELGARKVLVLAHRTRLPMFDLPSPDGGDLGTPPFTGLASVVGFVVGAAVVWVMAKLGHGSELAPVVMLGAETNCRARARSAALAMASAAPTGAAGLGSHSPAATGRGGRAGRWWRRSRRLVL